MTPIDVVSLVFLASLWGGSFLFMRIAAPEFGPVALITVRIGLAAMFLLPVVWMREGLGQLRRKFMPLLVVGLLNSAIPFCFFAYSTLYVTAGFAAVLNATAPLFVTLVAFVWLRQRPNFMTVLGLCVGLMGVVVLVWGRASFKAGGSGWAVLAGLSAALLYGVAANYTKRYLHDTSSLMITTGSLILSSVSMVPFAIWMWPSRAPSQLAWLSATCLAIGCTAAAYLIYFRLIARVGPIRAITVTFLVPIFGMIWGALFLDERVTWNMVTASATILLGTSLATGMLQWLRLATRREVEPQNSYLAGGSQHKKEVARA